MTANGWFAARPSGTENMYKIYAESFLGETHLRRLIDDAQALLDKVLSSVAASERRWELLMTAAGLPRHATGWYAARVAADSVNHSHVGEAMGWRHYLESIYLHL